MVTSKFIQSQAEAAGKEPGALVHVADGASAREVHVSVLTYNAGEPECREAEVKTLNRALPLAPAPAVTWINIDGLSRLDVIEMVGQYFDIHPLVLEDLLNTDQRPKLEDYGDYLFLVAKMLTYEEGDALKREQVSFLVGANYVVSFLEDEGDVFDGVRDGLRNGKGRLCREGPDFLVYSLLDAVVDSYFAVLERVGDRLEDLEEELVASPGREDLNEIHRLKRDMLFLRKAVWPLREAVGKLERLESPLVRATTGPYLRDVYDHAIQLMDTVETFRDMLSGMLDIYLSSISNRINEVMKVLTIIATIFIPLTFIAGVYGMNFRYMPELGWRWSYPLLWLVMIGLGIFMLAMFKRRKWL